jgi:SAM-dependent methyltransferase
MSANADQKTYWNEVAGAKWVANQERLDRLMAPLTTALLQEAAPGPGERVLDIGCGCGDLSFKLAEAVGPAGAVLAVDLSRPMLAHAASRETARPPHPQAPITWREADAMTESVAPEHDLMVSRFGIMFFEDKARAFANLRTAMKPGGRFAFLTWRGRAEIEWFQAPLEWIAPILPMPAPMDGAPGPCGLADGEGTRALFEAAGFHSVVAEPVDRALLIGDSVDEALALLIDAGPTAAQLREAEPQQRDRALRLLRNGLEARAAEDGHIELRGACWIYRGVA